MPKQQAPALSPLLAVDPDAAVPLHRQLYGGLRGLILDGRLAPGARLPSTRVLAADLRVSRMTLVGVFEQLITEGYIEGRVGAGTFVARVLPEDVLTVQPDSVPISTAPLREHGLSQRGAMIAATPAITAPDQGRPRAFRTGLPALDLFPFDIWRRILAERYRRPPPELLAYGDPAGYPPLRQAIAAYLNLSRGVRCTAEQVIVVAGSQQALDLAARLLLDPGDSVWVEDPGYRGARGALSAAGAGLIPVPVDGEGLDVAAGERLCPGARIAHVTPSRQFPLGATLSLARRLALLDWAQRAQAWIVEDDYDSEYRYSGRPIAAMQGLDPHGRVIYTGTFSKVLFPALRLGYLVVPPDLVDAFVAARSLADRHPPTIEQAVLADFVEKGHFVRHIRRMRLIYKERQESLVDLAQGELAGLLEIEAADAGMHLIGWLPGYCDDRAASRQALACGVEATALSAYGSGATIRPGLLLGFTAFDEAEQRAGIRGLVAALRRLTGGGSR